MVDDDRPPEIIEKFPLRKIPFNVCECYHGNENHATELTSTGSTDAECEICVCKKFTSLAMKKVERKN